MITTLTKCLLLQMYSDIHLCVLVIVGLCCSQILLMHVCCESEELPVLPLRNPINRNCKNVAVIFRESLLCLTFSRGFEMSRCSVINFLFMNITGLC